MPVKYPLTTRYTRVEAAMLISINNSVATKGLTPLLLPKHTTTPK
ncbi:MAG: hypothetical protein QXK87_05685 [Fervidicoccaceae archaeon]